MNANLGRQLRLEKIYSRARNRADLLRRVDDEVDDEFEFPLSAAPIDEEQQQSLASLMGADGDGAITFEPAPRETVTSGAETD